MTDTSKDLTAPEAVERLIVWLMDAHEMGDTSKNPEVWRTLEALSAAYEREKARAEAAEAERDALDAVLSARVGCTDLAIIKAKSDLEAAEARLKEAVKVMKAADGHLQKLGADGLASGIYAFLASLGGNQ